MYRCVYNVNLHANHEPDAAYITDKLKLVPYRRPSAHGGRGGRRRSLRGPHRDVYSTDVFGALKH